LKQLGKIIAELYEVEADFEEFGQGEYFVNLLPKLLQCGLSVREAVRAVARLINEFETEFGHLLTEESLFFSNWLSASELRRLEKLVKDRYGVGLRPTDIGTSGAYVLTAIRKLERHGVSEREAIQAILRILDETEPDSAGAGKLRRHPLAGI
jgi:hypothetical protein